MSVQVITPFVVVWRHGHGLIHGGACAAGGAGGGALYASTSHCDMAEVLWEGNTAHTGGGALLDGGTAELRAVAFRHNTATRGGGGGLLLVSCTANLTWAYVYPLHRPGCRSIPMLFGRPVLFGARLLCCFDVSHPDRCVLYKYQ